MNQLWHTGTINHLKKTRTPQKNRVPGAHTEASLISHVLSLQQIAGNRTIQRLLKSGRLRTKIHIGQPDDTYEHEADRVAERVMRMPEPVAGKYKLNLTKGMLSLSPEPTHDFLRRMPAADRAIDHDSYLQKVREGVEQLEGKITAKETLSGIFLPLFRKLVTPEYVWWKSNSPQRMLTGGKWYKFLSPGKSPRKKPINLRILLDEIDPEKEKFGGHYDPSDGTIQVTVRRNDTVEKITATLYHEALHMVTHLIETQGAAVIGDPKNVAIKTLAENMAMTGEIDQLKGYIKLLNDNLNPGRINRSEKVVDATTIDDAARNLWNEDIVRAETYFFQIQHLLEKGERRNLPSSIQYPTVDDVKKYLQQFHVLTVTDLPHLSPEDVQLIDTIRVFRTYRLRMLLKRRGVSNQFLSHPLAPEPFYIKERTDMRPYFEGPIGGELKHDALPAIRSDALQLKSAEMHEPKTAPSIVHQILRSPGRPLDSGTRAFFEPRFGQDFRDVRVHTDSRAAESVRAINARAYTVGQDIVTADGNDRPNGLLAHELAHVVQQSGKTSTLQRKCGSAEIGPTSPDCTINPQAKRVGTVGKDRFLFQKNCDVFVDDHEDRLKEFAQNIPDNATINVLGMASKDGPAEFNKSLSCERAFRGAEILMKSGRGTQIKSVQATGPVGTEGDTTLRAVDIQVSSLHVPPKKPPFPHLPPPVHPKDPPGPRKPPDTPILYCVPYFDLVNAMADWALIYGTMMSFTSRFGSDVQDLWRTYLTTPKSGTRGTLPARRVFGNQTSRVVSEFRRDEETRKQKDRIMKLIADRVRGNPALMPQVGQSTPLMQFSAVLSPSEMIDLPMEFTDGAHKIPGNIAGGFGKNASDAGDDIRNVDGQFIATNLGLSTIDIKAAFVFDILDCVDFCPGNPGDWKAQFVTVPMSRFEATPYFPTYDTPFEVIYGLHDDQSF